MIEFKENHAYHAETEEEAEWLLNKAHEQRYKWCDFTSFIQDNNWSKYTYQTCYSIKEGSFGDKGYYENKNYNIIKVKDLMQKNMNDKIETPDVIIYNIPEGYEFETVLENKAISLKKIKQKYPMELLKQSRLGLTLEHKLLLFGQLVITCREWNRIDGFENESITKRGVICRYDNCIKAEMWDSRYNAVLVFKDQSTAELFLSTFNKELQEVKEFL